jgi:hypothetical protein
MDTKQIPLYALIAILGGILIYLLIKKPAKIDPQEVKVILSYDSLPKTVNNSTIEKPIIFKPGEINIPPAQLQILQSNDTALLRQVLREVLSRYYEERVQHTTTVDSNIVIETWDTITENAIYGRKLQYKWLKPTATTIINPPNRVKLYAGASITAGQNGLYDISPQLSLALKKGTLIEVGYNTYALATGQDKYAFRFSLSQKIRLKK